MTQKSYFARKMDWLVEVAGTPGITLRALVAAVACADAAFDPGVVKKTQLELSSRLGKPQSAISPGCCELVELGFLLVRKNGNRTIYSLNFDPATRQEPKPRDAPPTLKQNIRNADEPLSAPPYKEDAGSGEPASTEARMNPIRSADEHYDRTPVDGGRAIDPAPLTARVEPIDLVEVEMDRAPSGAVRPDRLVCLAEEVFRKALQRHEAERFQQLVSRLGREEIGDRLRLYAASLEAGTTMPMPIGRWCRQAGLMAVTHVA